MIEPGTGILDDFGEGPYGMPFDLFGWCLVAGSAARGSLSSASAPARSVTRAEPLADDDGGTA